MINVECIINNVANKVLIIMNAHLHCFTANCVCRTGSKTTRNSIYLYSLLFCTLHKMYVRKCIFYRLNFFNSILILYNYFFKNKLKIFYLHKNANRYSRLTIAPRGANHLYQWNQERFKKLNTLSSTGYNFLIGFHPRIDSDRVVLFRSDQQEPQFGANQSSFKAWRFCDTIK